MQVFPKEIALVVGRLNPVNFLDRNRFANDPHNQFLNLSMNNDLLYGHFLQFSTYAALLTVPLTKDVTVAGAIYTAETAPGDYGGDWSDGAGVGLVDYKWEFASGLGGEANLLFLYSSANTAALDNPSLVPELITSDVKEKSNNWILGFVAEQYIWKPAKPAGAPNHVRTRAFDYHEPGVGLFFRFGYTPKDRNIWNMMTSGGVGARGVIPGRPYDRMGIGYYSLVESDDFNEQPVIGEQVSTELGLEAYYNFAITPWAQLSADIQWIDSGVTANKDVVVLGTRLFTQF